MKVEFHKLHLQDHTGTLLVIMVALVIIASALSVGTLLIAKSHEDVLKATHQAEYRICVRQMVNRAVIDLDKINNDEKHLPIYKCGPNKYGHKAIAMSTAEQNAFIEWVERTPEDQLP